MRVFSGIRPSGQLHIGNYLGAIRQWVKLQEKHNCLFCIVDLHAITTPYNPKELQKNIQETAIVYLAAGIDPQKSVFFVQSQIKEHSELAWLLGTITPVGELLRMTQYKEKSRELKEKSPRAGLLNYPILMAADILLYQTDLVPVGRDQKQHVELAASIAKKFNREFGRTFKVPKVSLPKIGAKIMSLQNPRKKMAKSAGKEGVALLDSPKVIKEKIMAAVTDPGKEIKYDLQRKPGISNLLTIYSLFSERPLKEIEKDFQGKGYEQFKKSLTQLLIEKLEPFRQKQKQLSKKQAHLQKILDSGAQKAQKVASVTMKDVFKKMGLV